MQTGDKPLVWMHSQVKSPPFSVEARIEAGYLLRMLQKGLALAMPQSRPMPNIGRRVHELRITDKNSTWRIIYRLDTDAIVIAEVFAKRRRETPRKVLDVCKQRLAAYDRVIGGGKRG